MKIIILESHYFSFHLLCTDGELCPDAGPPAAVLPAHELVVAGLAQLVAVIAHHHGRTSRLMFCFVQSSDTHPSSHLVSDGVPGGEPPVPDAGLAAHHRLAAGTVSGGVAEPSPIAAHLQ